MPVPPIRNKILPVRGNIASLNAVLADLFEGEICYAFDEDQYYQKENGVLVAVGATKAQGLLADSAIQPGDNVSALTNDAAYVDATGAAAAAPVQSVAGKTGAVMLVKGDVDLGNVDNTSDLNKPISTATQSALNLKADLVGGVIPNSQLPSLAISEYLGSVNSQAAMLALTGQRGDWCIRTDTGSTWVITTDGGSLLSHWTQLATPADAVTSVNGYTGTVVLGKADVGLGNVDNTSDLNKPVSTATQTALNLKANLASPTLTGTPTAPTATPGTNTTQLATTAFVADAVSTADEWTRTGTTLAPKTAGDVVAVSAGTAALPGLTPVGDADTGISFPVANTLDVSAGGTGRVRVNSTVQTLNEIYGSTYYPVVTQVDVGTGSNQIPLNSYLGTMAFQDASAFTGSIGLGSASYPSLSVTGDENTGLFSPGADQLAISTGGIQRATVDSSGRLLVGTSIARANFFNTTLSSILQIEGASSSDSANSRFISQTFGTAGAGGPIYTFAKHRSNSVGGTTVVQSADDLGLLSFQGSDGTEFVAGAQISAQVDGTPGTNNMPGRIVLSTTPSGSATPVERLRITNDGYLRLAGKGIQFNGDTADANSLDDYEEGTWTPSIGGTATYSQQVGIYTKVGRLVTASFLLTVTTRGTGSQQAISGLPFTSAANSRYAGSVSRFASLAANTIALSCYVPAVNTLIAFFSVNASGTSGTLDPNVIGDGTTIEGSITYSV
jgi:hypothetical protein